MLCIDNSPTRAVANIIGNINGQEFGVAKIVANIHRDDGGNRLIATLTNTPPTISTIYSRLYSSLLVDKFPLCVVA